MLASAVFDHLLEFVLYSLLSQGADGQEKEDDQHKPGPDNSHSAV